jgi:hypothetical protein
MTEAVFDFDAISKIANLRGLDGRPQNVEPKKPEPVGDGQVSASDGTAGRVGQRSR